MNAETETMRLDEINRILDLARERDPSIEPELGYSDSELQNSCAFGLEEPSQSEGHATNLSILTAAIVTQVHTPDEAVDIAIELYNHILELVGEYSRALSEGKSHHR